MNKKYIYLLVLVAVGFMLMVGACRFSVSEGDLLRAKGEVALSSKVGFYPLEDNTTCTLSDGEKVKISEISEVRSGSPEKTTYVKVKSLVQEDCEDWAAISKFD